LIDSIKKYQIPPFEKGGQRGISGILDIFGTLFSYG
jgi:hypothetical protein